MDCGAVCLPGLVEQVHALVEDARDRGARVLAGGALPACPGQFYPPTIVADVTPEMRVWREETFGPLMTVAKCSSDAHAVRPAAPAAAAVATQLTLCGMLLVRCARLEGCVGLV